MYVIFNHILFLALLSMSPTKVNCMDVTHHSSNQPLTQQTIRKSPKKRPLKRYTIVSSSSSTESLASDTKGNRFETYAIDNIGECVHNSIWFSFCNINHTLTHTITQSTIKTESNQIKSKLNYLSFGVFSSIWTLFKRKIIETK